MCAGKAVAELRSSPLYLQSAADAELRAALQKQKADLDDEHRADKQRLQEQLQLMYDGGEIRAKLACAGGE